MDRYVRSTPANFWDEFTEDGKCMSFTAISDRLRNLREEEDEKDANKAKEEYSEESFAQSFGYRKGGKTYTMQKNKDIAKRYRELRDGKK